MGYIRRFALPAAAVLLTAAVVTRGGDYVFALACLPLAWTARLCLAAAGRGQARRTVWRIFAASA
ncbi:MAG: hypothetical protein ACJ77M_08295, partial [Thermoleophilaceae bacterium]